MKITKRNGITTLFDDQKIINSILRANAETSETALSERVASHIADEVLSRLTENSEIITTQEVRNCVYEVLREKGFADTAKHYMEFIK